MDITINDLAEVTTIASGDFIAIWRTANGDTRKISRANIFGGLLTGGGTLATGGFTLTVPATGTAVLGTGTAGRVASFSDTNTIAASTLAKSGAGVLTLSASGAYTLTVPATGTAVLLDATQTLTNKTLTTPTIASFTNATHNHADAAGGGTIDHGALTGLSDDDHTQYFLLTGRAAGQSLTGSIAGTASSGFPRVLTINPTFTSNPTNNGTALEIKTRLDAAITSAFAQMHLNDVDTLSSGSSTYVIGLHISEQTFGTNNTNLYIKSGNGFATAASGNWALYSASTRDSYFAGDVGFGATPQGKLHAHDGNGGFIFVTKTITNSTAQTIIPNGTGDVLSGVYAIGRYTNTAGGNNTLSMSVLNGASFGVSTGGTDTITFSVAANGEFTVQRTLGTGTWKISMIVVWL